MRGDKASAALVIALDTLLLDKLAQPVERATGFANERARLGISIAPIQLIVVRLDLAADLAAVTRTATPAQVLGIDDRGRATGTSPTSVNGVISHQ